jgi:oleandomycin transport system ATP-binding protein
MTTAIQAEGVVKRFGDTKALEGVDSPPPPGPCWGCSAPTGLARRPPFGS